MVITCLWCLREGSLLYSCLFINVFGINYPRASLLHPLFLRVKQPQYMLHQNPIHQLISLYCPISQKTQIIALGQ